MKTQKQIATELDSALKTIQQLEEENLELRAHRNTAASALVNLVGKINKTQFDNQDTSFAELVTSGEFAVGHAAAREFVNYTELG